MAQYMNILSQCIPNVDATNHMTNVDAALVISVGETVKAGATFRVCKMITPKSKGCESIILQVRMLAVEGEHQCKGYGSLLVHGLKAILSTLASPVPGFKLMHVQSDNNAVDFWANQRFVASSRADELTRMLAACHASGNEVYTGVVSMVYTSSS